MFSRKIDFYESLITRDKEKVVNGYDLEQLKTALPSKEGEIAWVTLNEIFQTSLKTHDYLSYEKKRSQLKLKSRQDKVERLRNIAESLARIKNHTNEKKNKDKRRIKNHVNEKKNKDKMWPNFSSPKVETVNPKQEIQFYEIIIQRQRKYQYKVLKVKVLNSEINLEAFNNLLDLVAINNTKFMLELDVSQVQLIQTASWNEVCVLHIHKCSTSSLSKWKTILEVLSKTANLKLLILEDIKAEQILDILKLESEINNLKICPKDKDFLKEKRVFDALSELKKKTSFATEIQIGE